tara:strand:- start:5604 stop:5897 length:294 start_codon:yes stop_codon:yes gene_type:complete
MKMGDFGKAVQHHIIDNDLTMASIRGETGLKEGEFRKILSGEKKPPVGWITNESVPLFMRVLAAKVHEASIIKTHDTVLALLVEDAAETDSVEQGGE